MSGIRINIKTGEIKILSPQIRRYEVRVCERCHHTFEVRRDLKNRFCSMSCAKKGQQNRLGKKHSKETRAHMSIAYRKKLEEAAKNQKEIVPHMKLIDRVKKPKFVNNHHQWANEIYGKYKRQNKVPNPTSKDYGLYKYGEWLFNNERYTSI